MKSIWANITVLALLVAGIGANVDEKITCLVNVIRKQQKLPPLTMDERLTKAAETQAKYQAKIKQMTHDGPNKTSVGNRADDAKYAWTTVAENVAYGFEDDETVMYKWWCSPGHKVNLLSPNKNHGSAKVFADNKVPYYAQVFGTEKTDPANAKTPSCDKYGKEIKKLEDLLKKPCDSPGTKPASTPPSPPTPASPPAAKPTAKTGRKKKKPMDDYDTGSDELPAPAASKKKDEEEEGYPTDESQVKKAKKSSKKKVETPPTPKEEDYPTDEDQVKKKDKKGTKKSPKREPEEEEEKGYSIDDNSAPKEQKDSKKKSRNAKKEERKKANNDEYDMGDLPLPPPLFIPTFPAPFPIQPAQPAQTPSSPRRTRSKKERRRRSKKKQQSKNHSNN